MPRSVNQPNRNESGIWSSCISWNFLLRIIICPRINIQFHITSHVPSDMAVNLQLITLATDEIGETPSSPCFVNATPNAEKINLL